jgi:hypothetical protein
MIPEINNILNSFAPVGLEEMDNVRLMDRIDTKYVLPAPLVLDLLEFMTEGYRVLEINGHRISSYDTTYLDTLDFLFFNQHVTGRIERSKVRFRKYNSTGVTFLEIKQKTKKRRTVKWRIENNLTENSCDMQAIKFINKHVPFSSEILKPVITNNFKRITLVGTEATERITLDMDLSFSGTDGQSSDLANIAIAELKSDGLAIRSPFSAIIRRLPVYPSEFSKYCVGNALIYDIPRKNILKPTLLLINKIENECNRSISA